MISVFMGAFFVCFLLYFVNRRVLDSFAIAAVGILVYYFPIFFDGLRYMSKGADLLGPGKEVNIHLQFSILLVFLILILGSLIKGIKKKDNILFVYSVNDNTVFFISVISCVVLSFVLLPLISIGVSKTSAFNDIGGYSILLQYLFSLGFLFAGVRFKSSKSKSARFFILCFMFYVLFFSIFIFQTRSIVFFSFLSVFICYLYGYRFSVKDFKLKYLAFLVSVLLLVVGKHIGNYFVYGVTYDNFYLVFLDSMESIGISSNLNYVYFSNIDVFYLHNVFLNLIPFYKTEDYYDYHDVVKDYIFPFATYGMGRNPIGEMWINLKYVGVFIYAIVLVVKCYIFDFLIKRSEGLLKAFFTFLMVFLVFYVNRNAMHNDISYLRNYMFFMIAIVFLSSFFHGFVLFNKRKL